MKRGCLTGVFSDKVSKVKENEAEVEGFDARIYKLAVETGYIHKS